MIEELTCFKMDVFLAYFNSEPNKVGVWANLDKIYCESDGSVWIGRRHIVRAKSLREVLKGADAVDFWLVPSDLRKEPWVRLVRFRFGAQRWLPLELDTGSEGAAFEWMVLTEVSYEGHGLDVRLEMAPIEVRSMLMPSENTAQA